MIDHIQPRKNYLLNCLHPVEYERLSPYMEKIDMPLGKVLYESGGVLDYAYFPIDCIVSLLYILGDGSSAEIAVVGNDGIIGIAVFRGGNTMPNRAVVQSAGCACCFSKLYSCLKFTFSS
jgi:hypothetical protein